MDKQELIDSLAQEIIAKNITPELKQQATQLVMGSGNPNAQIVFIGEAPGKKEDELGVPFMGAAGKFLDAMLQEAGMNRVDVYITNIVKYRPPNNRDPLPAEKAEFWPYLLRQLQIINPKAIITLGRHSGGYFIPGLQISQAHGTPQQIELGKHTYTVIPLYHPAAALYNGGMRQVLIDDFKKAAQVVHIDSQK